MDVELMTRLVLARRPDLRFRLATIVLAWFAYLSLFSLSSLAQMRTRTEPPFPNYTRSVAWIVDQPYVAGGGHEQRLDLYLPTDEKGEPLVVYVHGGGWVAGDKAGDSINPNNLQWLWEGYAMASINYRLAQNAKWPAQLQDCKAAIRWLKARAAQYGYDPNRIAVVGESAGGHLVAMLGTTSNTRAFDIGENLDQTSSVTCVVDMFGVGDVGRLPSVAERLFGQIGSKDPDFVRTASPITYVYHDQPPVLLIHGTDDKLVPYEQAEVFADAMDRVGARYHFHTVVGGGHNPYFGLAINSSNGSYDAGGGGIGLFADHAVEPMILAFLRENLAAKISQ